MATLGPYNSDGQGSAVQSRLEYSVSRNATSYTVSYSLIFKRTNNYSGSPTNGTAIGYVYFNGSQIATNTNTNFTVPNNKSDAVLVSGSKTVSLDALSSDSFTIGYSCNRGNTSSPAYFIVSTKTSGNIYVDVYATSVGNGSVSIVDNGNNSITISGKTGTNGTNNNVSSGYIYWKFNNSDWNSETVTYSANSNFTKSVSIPSGATSVQVDLYTEGKLNTTKVTSTINVIYYGNPGAPGIPILYFRKKGPVPKEEVYFSWSAASAGTNVPVKGYRLRIYKNGRLLLGIDPNDASSSWWDTGSTSTRYDFVGTDFAFEKGDRVKLGIYSYGINGKGTLIFNGDGTAEAQVNSAEYTFINAGIMRIKSSGTWKEGQVYIKINGIWKEADSIYIKQNGLWKESI